MWLLVVVLVVSSGIGLSYYLRVIVALYAVPPAYNGKPEAIPWAGRNIVLVGLMVLLIWFGVSLLDHALYPICGAVIPVGIGIAIRFFAVKKEPKRPDRNLILQKPSTLRLRARHRRRFRKTGRPRIDKRLRSGCGVCTVQCKSGAMKLRKREQRVLHPEDTFERIILQCLENGTLQNRLFDDPASKTQAFLRGFAGAFLRLPPVKRALMSNTFRSQFLNVMKLGARAAGKGILTQV